MSVDEIRRLPPTTGLLAYRNRRSVLLDLAGWDERHDAATIQSGKRETEVEQRDVFDSASRPAAPASVENTPPEEIPSTATRAEAVNDE